MISRGGGRLKVEVFESIEGVSVKLVLIIPFVAFSMFNTLEPFVGLVTTWEVLLLPLSCFEVDAFA